MPKKIFFSCLFLVSFMTASLLSARQYFNPINYEAYQGYKGAGNFVENSTYAGDVTGYLIGIGVGIVVSEPLRLLNYDDTGDDIATSIISGCTKGMGATFGGPSYFFHWMFYGTPKQKIAKPKNIIVNPKLLTAKEKNKETNDEVTKNIAARIKLDKVNRTIPKTEVAVSKSTEAVNEEQQVKEIQKKKKPKLTEKDKQIIAEHKKVEKKVSALEMTKKDKIDLGLLPKPESKEDIVVGKRITTLDKNDTESDEGKLENTQPASWNTPELPDWVKKQMGE
ncbi:MAG: hypothetical protein GY756_22060 [bacterium]|nr:hypothetical protein [bacterium]